MARYAPRADRGGFDALSNPLYNKGSEVTAMARLAAGERVLREGHGTIGRVVSCGRKHAVIRFANATLRLRISELEVNK